ncbi:NfeD family protein [Hyphobacterium marinum]|uniref:NfeD family protein n=1 Tax=Hyphobacterium marinum TaxID=3116574 RepID=A0ABU7LWX0_9PROT|nr:NfeD family protein [Hyphobacterium sp. Y6023]MEE2566019.1 NfeD family protein [Hyphobacterium sp. Y6023]
MDLVIEFLQGLNIWWWLGLAGVLLIGELITGTTYLLWPAAAALITGLLTLPFIGIDWPIQLLVFSVVSVALLYIGDRFVKPRLKSGSESGLNTRATYLVGERVTVVGAFSGGKGRVRHGDTEWTARTEDGADINPGDRATVRAVDGTTLVLASEA